jgi:hypothetical protein
MSRMSDNLISKFICSGLIFIPLALSADYWGGNGGQWTENSYAPMNNAQWSNEPGPGLEGPLCRYRWCNRLHHHCCYCCPGPHPYYNPYVYDSPYYNNDGGAGVYFRFER